MKNLEEDFWTSEEQRNWRVENKEK